MNRNKTLIISLSVILFSIFIIALLYKNAHPLGGIETHLNPSDVREKSAAFLNEIGMEYESLSPEVKFHSDNSLLSNTQKQYGLKKSNELFRMGVPGYYWQVNWKSESDVVIRNSNEQENPDLKEASAILKYNVDGRLLEFGRKVADSLNSHIVTRSEAEKIAVDFISKYVDAGKITPDTVRRGSADALTSVSFSLGSSGNVVYKEEKKTELGKRTDYEFYFSGKDKLLPDENLQVTVTVSGNIVTGYKAEFILQENKSVDLSIYEVLKSVLFYLVIFIMLAIIGFRRIRAFEIGFRTAVIMGLIVAVCFGLEIYLSLSNNMGWEVLIPLIIGPLFYGGGVLLIWGVSETVTREVWNEKFISIDLLTKGYFLHSKVGSSVLMGLAGGGIIAALMLLLIKLIDISTPLGFTIDENTFLSFFNSPDAGLSIINHFIYSSIFITAVFFLFLVSGLRRRVNTLVLFIVAAGLWGIVNARGIEPIYISILVEVVIGIILVWLFYKYDVLLILLAITSFSIFLSGPSLFIQDNSAYLNSGLLLASGLFIILLVSIISLYTKDSIKDFQNITPAFVKNITERQRMQRELEIARDVQMSFLPRESPQYSGLDISGKCLPALEVGGDYYDFVNLGSDTGGIIVGDVSGKGTQAAFYMTLTKGFLKAVSRLSASPSEVLSQMNELFYENVERGTFISMIYGIFDTRNRTFRLARAGHNPVIAKSSGHGKIEMINPTGLALGLEKGTIFRKTIKEVEIPINSGEVYVFYTDGFTEAMNKEKEEYGEERLMRCIDSNSDCTSDVILEKVFSDVKSFIGKAIQHDDMTIVVVKVK